MRSLMLVKINWAFAVNFLAEIDFEDNDPVRRGVEVGRFLMPFPQRFSLEKCAVPH